MGVVDVRRTGRESGEQARPVGEIHGCVASVDFGEGRDRTGVMVLSVQRDDGTWEVVRSADATFREPDYEEMERRVAAHAVSVGAITPNRVRAMYGLPPLPGLFGDVDEALYESFRDAPSIIPEKRPADMSFAEWLEWAADEIESGTRRRR